MLRGLRLKTISGEPYIFRLRSMGSTPTSSRPLVFDSTISARQFIQRFGTGQEGWQTLFRDSSHYGRWRSAFPHASTRDGVAHLLQLGEIQAHALGYGTSDWASFSRAYRFSHDEYFRIEPEVLARTHIADTNKYFKTVAEACRFLKALNIPPAQLQLLASNSTGRRNRVTGYIKENSALEQVSEALVTGSLRVSFQQRTKPQVSEGISPAPIQSNDMPVQPAPVSTSETVESQQLIDSAVQKQVQTLVNAAQNASAFCAACEDTAMGSA